MSNINKKKKILVVGGDSQIGSALFSYLEQTGEYSITTTRRRNTISKSRIYLDLDQYAEKWSIPDAIDVAVLCAGVTKLDDCRKDPNASVNVNIKGVCSLAERLIDNGSHIIFLSTNQVFDGSQSYPQPEDPVSPVTSYGKQKAEAERIILSQNRINVTVLRMTKVIGSDGFILFDWLQALRKGETIHPFTNMYIAPIPLSFVISVLMLLIGRCLSGILHLSADRDISYSEMAAMAGQIIGTNPSQIKPKDLKESDLADSILPNKTALNIERLKTELGVMPPPVQWTIKTACTFPQALSGLWRVNLE